MKRISILVAAAALAGCANLDGSDGWITLIDGDKGLESFDRFGDANWRAEGGAIVADSGKGGHLVSKGSYRDFELRAEFWAEHNTNSGIYMRCADRAKITDKSCYEANIFDERPDPSYGTGGITNFVKVTTPMKAAGKWNVYEITARGSHISVTLNGTRTAELEHSQLAEGPFTLQYGTLPPTNVPGGAIRWRKLQIRPL